MSVAIWLATYWSMVLIIIIIIIYYYYSLAVLMDAMEVLRTSTRQYVLCTMYYYYPIFFL
jgi:hypothetical protein